jgi:chromosome segregation ATPase
MFKQLTIENFQSHKKSVLDFSPGINSVVGPSDSGKSAVLRGLQWLIYNRPGGESFVSYWAKNDKGKINGNCKINIICNSHHITRGKTSSFNGYVHNGNEYAAVRADVPETISTALNLSEVNIQKQISLPFLISKTSGEIARFLNKIIKLETIDTALYSIGKKQRENQTGLKQAENNIQTYTEQLKDLEWLDKYEKLLGQAEKLQVKLDGVSRDLTGITENIEVYKQNKLDIKYKFKPILEKEKEISRVIEINNSISDCKNEIFTLEENIIQFKSQEDIIKSAEKYILISEKGYIEKIIALESEILSVKNEKNIVEAAATSYNILREDIEEYELNIKKIEVELPDVCPMCNGTGKLK